MTDPIFVVIILIVATIILLEPHYRSLESMSGGVEAQLGSGRYYTGQTSGMISPANAAWSNIDAYGGGSITNQQAIQLGGARQGSAPQTRSGVDVQALQYQNYVLQQRLQATQQQPEVAFQKPVKPTRRSFWDWLFGRA